MMLPAGLWITAAARTPVTGRSRAQADLDAATLAAQAVRAVVGPERTVTPGAEVGAVVVGNCTGPGGNLGRIAALGAGLGTAVPGWTVDAQCGSGIAAVVQAAQHAALTGRACVAAGVESPSTAPERRIAGVPYTQAPMVPSGWEDPDLTAAADRLAAAQGITRARQEAFAARSHRLALAAAAHRPAHDDGPRRLGAAHLSRFPAVFAEADPVFAVTGGTAARIADGAAAVRVECSVETPTPSAEVGEADGAVPDAVPGAACAESATLPRPCRIVAAALTGSDPALPGLAPVAAIEQVLSASGDTVGHDGRIAVVEVVEAYAVQALAVLDAVGLARPGGSGDEDVDPRVNARGGALAWGHPWGASGVVAVLQAVQRLQEQPPGARALVTAAVAGGMGIAMTLEVS
ncbi:acetyl-CoA acetyltransferase [Micrococcus sp. FDAARGOS_333]|uniref:thiolase family protein n=1 Tax=Micrococcus sp. FDAARGOS_333 TaxID=1930558 RepID=UPI000B4E2E8B|nr:acetyl-CoA acetyltransferase [Micrococcus sp. FDAARGOS_333]PNL16791.1 acetyl-CoA C-acyltransferase [Micrococcus sp. FDAARGOS_333]